MFGVSLVLMLIQKARFCSNLPVLAASLPRILYPNFTFLFVSNSNQLKQKFLVLLRSFSIVKVLVFFNFFSNSSKNLGVICMVAQLKVVISQTQECSVSFSINFVTMCQQNQISYCASFYGAGILLLPDIQCCV